MNGTGDQHSATGNLDCRSQQMRQRSERAEQFERAAEEDPAMPEKLVGSLAPSQHSKENHENDFAQREPDGVAQAAGEEACQVHPQTKNGGSGEGFQGLRSGQLECHVRLLRASWPSVYMTMQRAQIRQKSRSFFASPANESGPSLLHLFVRDSNKRTNLLFRSSSTILHGNVNPRGGTPMRQH